MAFTVTETTFLPLMTGSEGLCLLFGTYTNTLGSTGGDIKPGHNTVNAFGPSGQPSTSMRVILEGGYLFTSTSTSPSEIQAIKTFDMTQQGDIITITTAANQSGTFCFIGQNAGL